MFITHHVHLNTSPHPTANFPEHVVEQLPPEIQTGIYYGWAKVDDGPTHKMVMSIGWNPYYKNEKKSMVSFFYYFIECVEPDMWF